MLGLRQPTQAKLQARLTRNIASTTGREDYVQVTIEERDGDYWVTPVAGKPNQIFTMLRAHGVVRVPLNANGLAAGEVVEVQVGK
jgi:molybdopterin molybdotransferase